MYEPALCCSSIIQKALSLASALEESDVANRNSAHNDSWICKKAFPFQNLPAVIFLTLQLGTIVLKQIFFYILDKALSHIHFLLEVTTSSKTIPKVSCLSVTSNVAKE